MTPEETPSANPILDALVNATPLEEAISMAASLARTQGIGSAMRNQDSRRHKVTLASSSKAQVSSLPEPIVVADRELDSKAGKSRGHQRQGRRERSTKEQPRAKGIGAPIDIARKSVRARLAPSAPVADGIETQRRAKEQPQPPASSSGRRKASSGASRTEMAAGSAGGRYGGQPRQSQRSSTGLPRQSSPSPPPRSCRGGTSSLQQGSEQIGSSSGSRSSAKVSSPRSFMDGKTTESSCTNAGTPRRVNQQPWSISSPKKSSPWASSTPKAASRPCSLSRVAEEYDTDALLASGQHEALASALSSMQSSIQSMYEDKVSASTRRILRGCKLGSLSAPALRKGGETRAHQGFTPSERSSSSSASPTPLVGGRRYFQDVFERTSASEFAVLEQELSSGSADDSRSEAKPSRWFSGRLVTEEQTIPNAGGDKLNGPAACIDEEEIPLYSDNLNGEKLLSRETCIDYSTNLLASMAGDQSVKAFVEKLNDAGMNIDETDLSCYMDQGGVETSLGPREFIAGFDIPACLDQARGQTLMASSDCIDEIDARCLNQAEMDCIYEGHLPAYMETTVADELPDSTQYVADEHLASYLGQSLGGKLFGATVRADDATDRTIYLEHAPSSISPSRNYSQEDDISPYLSQAGGDMEELPSSITLPGGCIDANDQPTQSFQASDDASITQNTDVDEVVEPHEMTFQQRRAVFEKSPAPEFPIVQADIRELVETEELRTEPMTFDSVEAEIPSSKPSLNELTRRMEKLMAILAPKSQCSLQAD